MNISEGHLSIDHQADCVNVAKLWQQRRVPDADAIMFGDGALVTMDHYRLSGQSVWQPLLLARQWEPISWLEVDTTLTRDARDGLRALGGDCGSHGSIGWVALTDAQDALRWVAVSRWSNPFDSVTVDDQTVSAVSTLGEIWSFPLTAPQDVTIAAG